MGNIYELLWKISWQTAVLAAIVWLICKFAGKAPASWRYALWLIVVVKFLIPPFAYMPPMALSPPAPISSATPPAIHSPVIIVPLAQQVSPKAIPITFRTSPSITPNNDVHLDTHLKAYLPSREEMLWVCGMLIMAALLLVRQRRLQKIVNNSIEPNADLRELLIESNAMLKTRRVPEIRLSPQITTPTLVGLFHPVILLPIGIDESCSHTDLSAMLLHELAHIKRYDMVGLWIHQIFQVIFFFNPIVWLAGRELRRERELACDELVLSIPGITRHEYAAGYVSALKLANGISSGTSALAMAEPFDVEKTRLHTILSKPLGRLTYGWMLLFVILAGVGLVTFTGMRSKPEDPKISATKANMTRIAAILQLYARDHGGRLPVNVGLDWVMDCKKYMQTVPDLYSPFNHQAKNMLIQVAHDSGVNISDPRILDVLSKRHQVLTDYQLVNTAAGEQLDTLNPTSILLIDRSTDDGSNYICMRTNLTFQKINPWAADSMLFQPSKRHRSKKDKSADKGIGPLKLPVWLPIWNVDLPSGNDTSKSKIEHMFLYANPPRWSQNGITAFVRGIARIRATDPLHPEERLGVFIEGYNRSINVNSYVLPGQMLDSSKGFFNEVMSQSGGSNGSFSYIGLFTLSQGAKSIKQFSLALEYNSYLRNDKTISGPYPIDVVMKPFKVANGDMIIALADFAVDQRPTTYLEFLPYSYDNSNVFQASRSRKSPYMSARMYMTSTGKRWPSLRCVVVYDANGQQVILSKFGSDTMSAITVYDRFSSWEQSASKPYIGLQIENSMQKKQAGEGIRVIAITPNGPAWKAGIKLGDKILRIGSYLFPAENGGIYDNPPDCHVGVPVNVIIQRNGRKYTAAVTPIEDPLLGNIDYLQENAKTRLLTSYFTFKSDLLKSICMVSNEPVPADYRPSKVEFWFDDGGLSTSDKATKEIITFRNIPIPSEFWKKK